MPKTTKQRDENGRPGAAASADDWEDIPGGEPSGVTAQRRKDYQKMLTEWRQIAARKERADHDHEAT